MNEDARRERTALKREIARRFYLLGKSQAEIAQKLGLKPPMVSRLMAEAKKEGIITTRIFLEQGEIRTRIELGPSRTLYQCIRQPELESRLRNLYPHLEQVVIVDVPPKSGGTDEEKDDALHRDLGAVAAYHLYPLLRESDHIGVGGGRGPAYTVDGLKSLSPPLPFRDIKLTSLSGNMHTLAWAEEGRSLDADDILVELSKCFELARRVKLGLPVVYTDAGVFLDESHIPVDPRASQASPLFLARWEEELNARATSPSLNKVIPNIAIVGIGSLTIGHHFLKHDRLLAPILDHLKELERKSKQITMAKGYYPVADLCNHLMKTSDPEHGISAESNSDLDPLIADINRHILGARPQHLRMVRDRVLAVAGGRYKHQAIRTALLLEPPVIHGLVTERDTAEWLVMYPYEG
jgi:DNA-binding transcriptional regulator LsrR (DeoR family)